MDQESHIERQLQELELCLLQPSVRKSQQVRELLAEGFVEFGSSGRTFTKEQIIADLRAEATTNCTAAEFKVQLLAPHVALVTYHAHRHTEPPVHTLRCSVWVHRQGRWQMVFHQGTSTSVPD
jgi:hypothetical protein